MLPYLAIAMEDRGSDAWGASDGTEVVKYIGGITETWGDATPVIDQWKEGIFHTRAASSGTGKAVENAHPFIYPKHDGSGDIIGIHNGCLTNHGELNHRLERDFAVDSMHLWKHRAEGKPWDDIHGWGNIVWYETWPDGNRVISLCRFNSDNLVVCKLKDGSLIFCSTYTPISVMARMFNNPVEKTYIIDEYRRYYFDVDSKGEWGIFRTEDMYRFTRTATVDTTKLYHNGRYRSQGGGVVSITDHNTSKMCHKCNQVGIADKDQLLCFPCFNFAVRQFKEADPNDPKAFPGAWSGEEETCDCTIVDTNGNVKHMCGIEYQA